MRFAALLASVLLASCTSMPPATTIAKAQLGQQPDVDEAKSLCLDYLDRNLKDPESARLRFGALEKSAYRATGFSSVKFAWQLTCWCNAKNSFGGYVGEHPYHFYLLSEPTRLVGVMTASVYDPGIMVMQQLGGGGLTAEQAGL